MTENTANLIEAIRNIDGKKRSCILASAEKQCAENRKRMAVEAERRTRSMKAVPT